MMKTPHRKATLETATIFHRTSAEFGLFAHITAQILVQGFHP